MGSRKLPPGTRVYENERFMIPEGWTDLGKGEYEKIDGSVTMKVLKGATHDDWSFSACKIVDPDEPWTWITRTGEASSRLAAMRKAELATRGLNR